MFAGTDRDSMTDAATGDTASASPRGDDAGPDATAVPDSHDASIQDASFDNTSDTRAFEASDDRSLLDSADTDAAADTAVVDTTDDSPLDGSPLDGSPLDDGPLLDGSDDDAPAADTAGDIGSTCPGACDVDSLRCDGPNGFVCEVRNGCGTWVQRVTCPGDDMCCPSGSQLACVTPDANHCFSCSNACAGATPACSAERKACVCNSGSCPSSFGCDGATGACTPCTTPTSDAADFYADIQAGAGGTGSANCPFRTISEALTLAGQSKAVAKTIHIAPGIYNVESFPLVIRNGITLEGAGADKVTIAGLGNYTVYVPTTQAFRVTAVLGDATHDNSIRGVTIMANTDAKVAHYGVICDDGNLTTPKGSDPPKIPPNSFLRDVTFLDDYDMAIGVSANPTTLSGGNLRVDHVHFQGSWGAVWAETCLADSQPSYGNIEVSASRFSGQTNAAITVRGCVSVDLTNSVFEDGEVGLRAWSENSIQSDHSRLRVDSNTFQRLRTYGASFDGMLVELSNNSFLGNTTDDFFVAMALRIATSTTGRKFYARGNRFVGNDIAIMLEGTPPTDANNIFDFGTASDPGRNEFRCNSAAISKLITQAGFDVGINALATPGWVFQLAGNQWDHAPPSLQSIPGSIYNTLPWDGVDVLLGNGNAATAVDTSGATRWVGACPADHIPGPDVMRYARPGD
jgi:hypothetical protein